jgi:hypothetical protein
VHDGVGLPKRTRTMAFTNAIAPRRTSLPLDALVIESKSSAGMPSVPATAMPPQCAPLVKSSDVRVGATARSGTLLSTPVASNGVTWRRSTPF